MKTLSLITAALLGGLAPAFAQSTLSNASGSVVVLLAPPGDLAGGGRVSNAGGTLVVDVSVGDPASGVVSNVTGGGVRTKGNFIGQLVDPVSLAINGSPNPVNEGGTSQLSGIVTMDDGTTLHPSATAIAWSVGFGPVASLTLGGLVTTAPVLGPTSARLNGTFQGVADPDGTLLNVIDTGESDTFQQYAADQIDDGWQIAYFGLPPNANAAPTADPDGDGRNNRFEFLSGFVPTDPGSFFQFTITGLNASVADLRLNKVIPGRTYRVKANTDLIATPTLVGAPFTVASEQTDRLFQDAAATGGKKFYYLEISKP